MTVRSADRVDSITMVTKEGIQGVAGNKDTGSGDPHG
jgi:hypothetical protein